MGGIRRILPPTCDETATFRAKLIGRPLWSDFYSRLAALPAGHQCLLSGSVGADAELTLGQKVVRRNTRRHRVGSYANSTNSRIALTLKR